MSPGYKVDVIHHLTCQHQVEVEVLPPRMELYFKDEPWTDLLNTQIRFEATVLNSGKGVHWQVYAASGGPGAGSIDATGLYQAPDKGSVLNGHTDIVVATSVEDPLRKAYAWVTLLGQGPLIPEVARIEIWPRRINLYCWAGADNSYIDDSNKLQLFQAEIWNSSIQTVTWHIQSGPGFIYSDGLYMAPTSGSSGQVVVVRGTIGAAGAYDEAQIVLLNYDWPGLH